MMKSTPMIVAASALIAMPLYAQEADVTAPPPSAPASPADNAFEVSFGLGYAQGFGDIGAGLPSLTDQSSAGGELQLGLGWRINPHFMVGVYGTGNFTSFGKGGRLIVRTTWRRPMSAITKPCRSDSAQ